MESEEQRIAIAQACGLQPVKTHKLISGKYVPIPGTEDWNNCPDYLNDLNAMHEAEEILTPRQREIFADLLGPVVWNHFEIEVPQENDYIGWIEHSANATFELYHATASQRAEAFLRTLNLWKE